MGRDIRPWLMLLLLVGMVLSVSGIVGLLSGGCEDSWPLPWKEISSLELLEIGILALYVSSLLAYGVYLDNKGKHFGKTRFLIVVVGPVLVLFLLFRSDLLPCLPAPP